jgi:hypothetical protein
MLNGSNEQETLISLPQYFIITYVIYIKKFMLTVIEYMKSRDTKSRGDP